MLFSGIISADWVIEAIDDRYNNTDLWIRVSAEKLCGGRCLSPLLIPAVLLAVEEEEVKPQHECMNV